MTLPTTHDRPELTLVTNPRHDDAAEDELLARLLSDRFRVRVLDIAEGTKIAGARVLVRNAWPTSACLSTLEAMCCMHDMGSARLYNPPHWRRYREDKGYLRQLYLRGLPVIPTMDRVEQVRSYDWAGDWVVKPNDGGSSVGVERTARVLIDTERMRGQVAQPFLDLVEEFSLYFIDGALAYAMRTGGRGRWELEPFEPSDEVHRWALGFVAWNDLPYGLQRVDGGVLRDGSCLLMEIEDQVPYLSLAELDDVRRARFVSRLAGSLERNLFAEPAGTR